MEKSLFAKYVLYFTTIAKEITERINGKKTVATYLFKDMLTKEISTDLKWESMNVDGSNVTADVVALDSALPLKRRDSISMASGTIPKLGMKMALNEKTMSEIDILVNANADTSIIVGKIYNDASRCLIGIYEKLEFMFLQGLSNGITLIDDDTNVGKGIRVNFNYLPGNSFGVSAPWSDAVNAKPLDDIDNIILNAGNRGDVPMYMWMDKVTFQRFAATTQVKERYAFSVGFSGNNVQSPDLDKANNMLAADYGITIVIVNRTVRTERDGVRTTVKPWGANKVILTSSNKVGKLVYGILAEATRPNLAVQYVKTDDYILLKKWHSPEPFAEWTSSQALVLPVIENVDSIYTINSEEASLDVQTEGDANFLYNTVLYTKASVATRLKVANPDTSLTVASTDKQLMTAINKLSDSQIAIFENGLITA